MLTLAAQRMLHPEGDLSPGWLQITDDRITRQGRGAPPPEASTEQLADGDLLAPGFVDIHAHGGGGYSFDDPDLEHVSQALAVHRAHGTTTSVASLVTASPEQLGAQITNLSPLVEAGELAGVHLEGPCLSPSFKGAHSERWLTDPERLDLTQLAAPGVVIMITLAPELPGALAAVRSLTDAGVTVALGHTAADAPTFRSAIQAGATVVTHLYNAMPSVHHRSPGPIPVALTHPQTFVELVADGHHVAPEVLMMAGQTASERTILVTDAMAGAGAADGDYPLGELTATVKDGLARIGHDGAIAGSTLTMDQAVRVMVRAGTDLAAALQAASATPARALNLPEVGSLQAGCFADAVALTADLTVRRVMRRGRWLSQVTE